MQWAFPITLFVSCISASPTQQQVLKLNDELSTVRAELIKADIIPNVIVFKKADFRPKYRLTVLWPSNKTAQLGNVISPDDVQDEPALGVQTLDSDAFDVAVDILTSQSHSPRVTVTMTDPDAPSRQDPKWSEFCHWIVKDTPITKPAHSHDTLTSKQEDIMPYKPPSPPEKTSFHRYVFLAFEPKNGTKEELYLSKPSDRKQWGTGKKRHGVSDWAKENELVPVAANFVFIQNEKQ